VSDSPFKLHKVIAGRGTGTMTDLDSLNQCDWVQRNGTDGYLCCVKGRDHEGLHEDHTGDHYRQVARALGKKYVEPETWWFPLKEWERNFGTAARACYGHPRQCNYSKGLR
jgi:hypothetical protein